jgi:hypothetical protein
MILDIIMVIFTTVAVITASFVWFASVLAIFQTREMTKEIYYQTTGKRYGAK